MSSFLKKILEPSEQEVFDHLIGIEKPSSDTFRSQYTDDVLSSPNVGLPQHLIQHQHPQPAYVTHTGPVVRMLIEQDEWRKTSSNCLAETEPNREPQEDGFEEENQVLSSSGTSTGQDSTGMPKAKSSLPSPSVCNRVIFARKPPMSVLPPSSLASSSKKE